MASVEMVCSGVVQDQGQWRAGTHTIGRYAKIRMG